MQFKKGGVRERRTFKRKTAEADGAAPAEITGIKH